MLTALAATMLTISTAALPTPPAAAAAPVAATAGARGAWTLSTVMPTPGSWALMGMGGLALIRSRRDKR